jgi:hypothetical protein
MFVLSGTLVFLAGFALISGCIVRRQRLHRQECLRKREEDAKRARERALLILRERRRVPVARAHVSESTHAISNPLQKASSISEQR